MQVMPATATYINGEKVTNEKLMTDIEFNVETSMKLLQKLKNRYKDWKLVFGAYNTGRPMVNQYAEDVYNFEADWSK
jgi:soluble lytic murein transglycosylase-like protein